MIDSKRNRIIPKNIPGSIPGSVYLGTTAKMGSIVGCIYSFFYRSSTATEANPLVLVLHGGPWKSNGKWGRPSRRYLIGIALDELGVTSRNNIIRELGPRKTVTLQDVENLDEVVLPGNREEFLRTYDLRKIRSLHTIEINKYLGLD